MVDPSLARLEPGSTRSRLWEVVTLRNDGYVNFLTNLIEIIISQDARRAHACLPITCWVVKNDQGPPLHSKFKSILGYTRPCYRNTSL